jgi:hypothetical protein
VGDITIDHTTFATVADAIEKHKIKVTPVTHFDDPDIEAQYKPDAVPASSSSLGTVPGFSSGELLVPPILGRHQEDDAMHECTHAFFDLQSIDINATEDEAISYVVDALYSRMTGVPKSRWGSDQISKTSQVVAGKLLHQYQLGAAGIPKVDDSAFKAVVLAVATDPFYFKKKAGLVRWLSGKDNRYKHDG